MEDKIIEVFKKYSKSVDTEYNVYNCLIEEDWSNIAQEVVKLFRQPAVMPSLPRTEADIEKEINRLINDDSNFISDNYGSEAADNGEYEVYFSQYSTEETLKKFAKWLLGNEA